MFVVSCSRESYIDHSSKLTMFYGIGEMSQKLRHWESFHTLFAKSAAFPRRRKRPAQPAGAHAYFDLAAETVAPEVIRAPLKGDRNAKRNGRPDEFPPDTAQEREHEK